MIHKRFVYGIDTFIAFLAFISFQLISLRDKSTDLTTHLPTLPAKRLKQSWLQLQGTLTFPDQLKLNQVGQESSELLKELEKRTKFYWKFQNSTTCINYIILQAELIKRKLVKNGSNENELEKLNKSLGNFKKSKEEFRTSLVDIIM